jgi:hypothetical protein
VVVLLMAIGDYSFVSHWWLFYCWLLMVILLMAIGDYSVVSHWLLFY